MVNFNLDVPSMWMVEKNIGNNLKTSKKWNIQGSWNGTIVLTNKNHKGCMLQML
jgi:hypothetical protein